MSEKKKTVVQRHAANFESLKRAMKNGDVALIETQLVATGEVVATIATFTKYGEEFIFTPFAIFLNGNPYELLRPPTEDGSFGRADNEP